MTSVAARAATEGGERGGGGCPPVRNSTMAITVTRQASQARMKASPFRVPRGADTTSTKAMIGKGKSVMTRPMTSRSSTMAAHPAPML